LPRTSIQIRGARLGGKGACAVFSLLGNIQKLLRGGGFGGWGVHQNYLGRREGCISVEDSEDALVYIAYEFHRAEKLDYVWFRACCSGCFFHVQDVIAEIEHLKTFLLAQEVNDSARGPHQPIAKQLVTRGIGLCGVVEANDELQGGPETIEFVRCVDAHHSVVGRTFRPLVPYRSQHCVNPQKNRLEQRVIFPAGVVRGAVEPVRPPCVHHDFLHRLRAFGQFRLLLG